MQTFNWGTAATRAASSVAFVAFVAVAPPSHAQTGVSGFAFTRIATQGDRAPGMSGARFEFEMTAEGLDPSGGVTFDATLTTGGRGIFVSRCGRVTIADGSTPGVEGVAKPVPDTVLPAALQPGAVLPGGAVLRSAVSVVKNTHGALAFVGDVTPQTSRGAQAGVYVLDRSKVTAIIQPGDALPGGGTLLTASLVPGNLDLNEAGDVAFTLTMRSESNGAYDTGVALWRAGHLTMIARSGLEIQNLGRIDRIQSSLMHGYDATGGANLNAAGQVAFAAVLGDHRVSVLLASPLERGAGEGVVEATPASLAINAGGVLRSGSKVGFALPHAGSMSLNVYSVDGRHAATLVQGPLAAGRHATDLDVARLAPGVYVLRLQSAGETVKHKFTLLR